MASQTLTNIAIREKTHSTQKSLLIVAFRSLILAFYAPTPLSKDQIEADGILGSAS